MKGPSKAVTLDELKSLVGKELGVSEWTLVDQKRIDAFADLTEDHQFIHVDPAAARQTPLGSTIAHGFLTLSLVANFGYQVVPGVKGAKMGMNYGINRLRFVSPVRAGSRVRGRFKLKSLEDQGGGRWLSTTEVTVEVEGQDKPSIVMEWLGMTFV
jgi:acyl dehydratase